MAEVLSTIDDLPPQLTVADTQVFWTMIGGVSYKVTLNQLRNWLGNRGFTSPTFNGAIISRGVSGSFRGLFIDNETGTFRGRWGFLGDNTAESGANAGTDLLIPAFDDTGTIIGVFLKGIRATLEAQFGGMVKFFTGTASKASFNVPPGVAKSSGLADGDHWLVNASGLQARRNSVTVTYHDTSNRPDGSQALAQGGSDTTMRVWQASHLKDAVQTHGGGFGQTWQDLMASREFATSYQNLTGKPIDVKCMYTGTAGASATAYAFEISTDNSTWLVVDRTESIANSTNTYGPVGGRVPPNHYYRHTRTGGTGTSKLLWAELR